MMKKLLFMLLMVAPVMADDRDTLYFDDGVGLVTVKSNAKLYFDGDLKAEDPKSKDDAQQFTATAYTGNSKATWFYQAKVLQGQAFAYGIAKSNVNFGLVQTKAASQHYLYSEMPLVPTHMCSGISESDASVSSYQDIKSTTNKDYGIVMGSVTLNFVEIPIQAGMTDHKTSLKCTMSGGQYVIALWDGSSWLIMGRLVKTLEAALDDNRTTFFIDRVFSEDLSKTYFFKYKWDKPATDAFKMESHVNESQISDREIVGKAWNPPGAGQTESINYRFGSEAILELSSVNFYNDNER